MSPGGQFRMSFDKMKKHDSSSGAFDGLGAILRELNFRADGFIRSQVRKLFATLPGYSHEDADALSVEPSSYMTSEARSFMMVICQVKISGRWKGRRGIYSRRSFEPLLT